MAAAGPAWSYSTKRTPQRLEQLEEPRRAVVAALAERDRLPRAGQRRARPRSRPPCPRRRAAPARRRARRAPPRPRRPSDGRSASTRTRRARRPRRASASSGRVLVSSAHGRISLPSMRALSASRPARRARARGRPRRLDRHGAADARDGRRAGHRPRRARLVRRHLGDDDGRDDAAVGRADGAPVSRRSSGERARRGPGGARPDLDLRRGLPGRLDRSTGSLAYGVYRAIVSAGTDWLAWDRSGRYVAGGALVAAGVYQLTPLKDVCLRHCRSPLHFILHELARRAASARSGWGSSTAPSASAAAGA